MLGSGEKRGREGVRERVRERARERGGRERVIVLRSVLSQFYRPLRVQLFQETALTSRSTGASLYSGFSALSHSVTSPQSLGLKQLRHQKCHISYDDMICYITGAAE